MFFLLVMIAFLVCVTACVRERQTLPLPDFPLSEETLIDALEEAGLPWTIAHEEVLPIEENILNFALYRDGATIGWLRSVARGDGRSLSITFLPHFRASAMEIYYPSKAYWENIIVFITILYGGFDNAHQVWNRFNDEIGTIPRNTIEPPPGWIRGLSAGHYIEAYVVWEQEINGVYFHIRLVRPLDNPNEYFAIIHVHNSMAHFTDQAMSNPKPD